MALEGLTHNFVDGDVKLTVTVWREVAEDDLRVEALDDPEFSDWMDENSDRIFRSALHKIRHSPHEHVSGTIFIKPGELIA